MPYNPGNSDMSGQLLMQGISNMGQGLGGGLEKMMLEQKKKEEQLKFAHSIRDSFAKMEKGHELLGYGSKDEMWADSLNNTLSRVDAAKVAAGLSSLGLQQRSQAAQAGLMEGELADQPAKQRRSADAAAMQEKAMMDQQEKAILARVAAQEQAKAQSGFLKSLLSGKGDDFEQNLQNAVRENPAVASDPEYLKGMANLLRPMVRTEGGKKYLINGNNTPIALDEKQLTAKDAAELELTKAKTDLTRSKMASATDTLAPMQAQADVLDKFRKSGVKRVRVADDGTVTDASSDRTSWFSIPIDEAIDKLHQASGGKVKFGSAEPAAQSSSEMIKVKSPDGRSGMIPKDKLEGALKAGYKKL